MLDQTIHQPVYVLKVIVEMGRDTEVVVPAGGDNSLSGQAVDQGGYIVGAEGDQGAVLGGVGRGDEVEAMLVGPFFDGPGQFGNLGFDGGQAGGLDQFEPGQGGVDIGNRRGAGLKAAGGG